MSPFSDIVMAIIIMSVTGTIHFIFWYATVKVLDKLGYIGAMYGFLRLIMLAFVFPLVYLLILACSGIAELRGSSGFGYTPVITNAGRIVIIMWAVGAAICFLFSVIEIIRGELRIRQAFRAKEEYQKVFESVCEEFLIDPGTFRLLQMCSISSPFIIGCLRPRIVIPDDEYTPQQLRVIFVHELTHYCSGDTFFCLIAVYAKAVNWFNPVIWWYARIYRRWSEFACDFKARKLAGGDRVYFETIVTIALRGSGLESSFSSALVKDSSEISMRMDQILRYEERQKRKKAKKKIAAALMIMMITSTSVITAATTGIIRCYSVVCAATEQESMDIAGFRIRGEYRDNETGIFGNDPEIGMVIHKSNSRSRIYNFTWVIKNDDIKQTPFIDVKDGDSVQVMIETEPADKDVWFGVVEPNGAKRYSSGLSESYHCFEVKTDGLHRVYVRNVSDETVTVYGSVIVDEK